MGENKILYVAVGKEVEERESTINWALNFSKGDTICIIHVHVPAQMILLPIVFGVLQLASTADGIEAPVSSFQEEEVKAFRECEQKEVLDMLDDCLRICALQGVPSEKICIEKESVTDGLLESISKLRISKLVMGAGFNSRFSRRITKPLLSRKANYVLQCAPAFCHIWFVGKDHLIYTSSESSNTSTNLAAQLNWCWEGVKQPYLDAEKRRSYASDNDKPNGILSEELSLRLKLPDFGGYECSSDGLYQSVGVNYSQSSTHSPEAKSALSLPHSAFVSEEVRVSGLQLLSLSQKINKYQNLLHTEEDPAFFSPRSSFANEKVKESGLQSLALPQSVIKFQDSSPPIVLVESSMSDNDQLEQAIPKAKISKREAFAESMRRRLKAEKEALEATCKLKEAQRLYFEELRQRKEIQGELAEKKKELEVTKNLLEKVSWKALDQKWSLESQLEKSCGSEKEMEEKLLSAVELLQKFKNRCDVLHVERDHAVQEAEELRKQLSQEPSSSCDLMFSEFYFSDLEKATNCFDPSLKVGEGRNGSTYKGFLHHTEVVIKLFKPNIHGAQKFQQEVDILNKLQHPNLVTLLGSCPESWALVYEYLPMGSLEDRLLCKDNPLPWQTRIQIATQLCCVLIFLHSRWPSSIIHGDLKPANILLDDNFVCKLFNFGRCRIISNGEFPMEPKFIPAEPEDTVTDMDQELLATGELTPMADIYNFGIILLRLLTGKPSLWITTEVNHALNEGDLNYILDPSAGNWPFVQAKQLAHMALRCCARNQKDRPDLASSIWKVLEPMKTSSQPLSKHLLNSEDRVPHYFICPIFQDIMEDPQIASDGFTYEAEAIRGWLNSFHNTSPMTNVKLANHDLIPNLALRSAIQEWLQHHRRV